MVGKDIPSNKKCRDLLSVSMFELKDKYRKKIVIILQMRQDN